MTWHCSFRRAFQPTPRFAAVTGRGSHPNGYISCIHIWFSNTSSNPPRKHWKLRITVTFFCSRSGNKIQASLETASQYRRLYPTSDCHFASDEKYILHSFHPCLKHTAQKKHPNFQHKTPNLPFKKTFWISFNPWYNRLNFIIHPPRSHPKHQPGTQLNGHPGPVSASKLPLWAHLKRRYASAAVAKLLKRTARNLHLHEDKCPVFVDPLVSRGRCWWGRFGVVGCLLFRLPVCVFFPGGCWWCGGVWYFFSMCFFLWKRKMTTRNDLNGMKVMTMLLLQPPPPPRKLNIVTLACDCQTRQFEVFGTGDP